MPQLERLLRNLVVLLAPIEKFIDIDQKPKFLLVDTYLYGI
jgi:hypothetical protein